MSNGMKGILSTVGKKFFLAITGLALFLFVCGHLAGNLLLFVGPEAFNAYSHKLISLGPLLYLIEIILLTFFLVHMYTAITTTWKNWGAASASRYSVTGSQGDPSRMTLSSRTMIWTGLLLLIFTVIHLYTFKYGPGMAEGYVAVLEGEQVRDLYRLVAESFANEAYVIFYVASMVFLGFHLRHGFWSAIQSLGGFDERLTPWIYTLGLVAAIILAVGFLVIPVWFYFGGTAS